MSDQFATGVHFMIFYLSFASSPNKLHHKYFAGLKGAAQTFPLLNETNISSQKLRVCGKCD